MPAHHRLIGDVATSSTLVSRARAGTETCSIRRALTIRESRAFARIGWVKALPPAAIKGLCWLWAITGFPPSHFYTPGLPPQGSPQGLPAGADATGCKLHTASRSLAQDQRWHLSKASPEGAGLQDLQPSSALGLERRALWSPNLSPSPVLLPLDTAPTQAGRMTSYRKDTSWKHRAFPQRELLLHGLGEQTPPTSGR